MEQQQNRQSSSPAANEEAQLLLRARCAELELRLAKQAELIADLRSSGQQYHNQSGHQHHHGGHHHHAASQQSQNAAASLMSGLSSSTTPGGGGGNNNSSSAVRDQFTLQRENGMLLEKNKSLETKLQIAQDSLASLQANLTREVQRAREEGDRHAQQLRVQLIEAQEHATCLQEKIVGLLGKDSAMKNAGLDDLVTENIFITTDAILHRLQTDRRLVGTAARSKYDVATEFRGRTLALTGQRVNVLQLKSEVLQMLNECYANLASDPTQRVDALRSRESANRSELEHLRRTIATQEQTISSLHTALHTANEKAARSTAEAEVAKRDSAVAIEKAQGQARLWEAEKTKLEREVIAMKLQLQDASGIQSMSVDSLKKEVSLSLEVRDELDRTRVALENALAAKETAERMAFAASQQVQSKDGTMESLLYRASRAEASAMRMGSLEESLHKAEQRIQALQEELSQLRHGAAEERGRTREKSMRVDGELLTLQNQLEEVSEHKLRLEEDLRRMEEAATNWTNFVTVVGKSAVSAATTPAEIVALSSSAATRVTRLEEENKKLREELQRAFEDMKTVATALRDTKTARENTLQLCDRLEMEKLRLVEEKKHLNDDLIAQRMQSKTREGEHTLRIQQLQHEVAYQKTRVDSLHQQYKRQIDSAGPSGSAASAILGGNSTTTEMPIRSSSTPIQNQQQQQQQNPAPSASSASSAAAGGGGERGSQHQSSSHHSTPSNSNIQLPPASSSGAAGGVRDSNTPLSQPFEKKTGSRSESVHSKQSASDAL